MKNRHWENNYSKQHFFIEQKTFLGKIFSRSWKIKEDMDFTKMNIKEETHEINEEVDNKIK